MIEGSSWADGRLRFFSDVDDNKPKPSADFYGEKPELNGFIELEFKPEVHILKIFAQHVRDQREEKLIPVSIAPSSTTTIGDLKQEISKKWDSMISYLLRGGKILDEGKTIRWKLHQFSAKMLLWQFHRGFQSWINFLQVQLVLIYIPLYLN